MLFLDVFCLHSSDLSILQTAPMLNGECFVVNFAVFTIDSTGRALVLPGLQDTEIIF